ncbi:hypothetical protein [Nitrosomonas europaea]|nr:hypothetical protein [Nitrosomonas europaea]
MCVRKSARFYQTQYGLLLVCLLWIGILFAQSPDTVSTAKSDTGNIAVWLDVNGAIGPAMQDYFSAGCPEQPNGERK